MSTRYVAAANLIAEFADGRITRLSPPGGAPLSPGDHYPEGVLLPSLHDHHFHPIGYAAAVTRLSVKDARDLEDLSEKLRAAARLLAPGEALIGNRLDDESLSERRLPTRADLDGMVGDRPVLLYRYCGHLAVANSAALEMAGVNSPTGILKETDIQPVTNVVGAAQSPLRREDLRRALAGLASLGLGTITAIVSVGDPLWCEVPNEIETLLEAAAGIPLDLEVLVIAATPSELIAAAGTLEAGPANVRFRGWKEFADGALGGRTAALYEPFEDDPGNRGILRLDHPHAKEMAETCLRLGGMVAIHAIGDLANDRVLDLFQELIEDGADPALLRIEHASVLTGHAIERMARLGVTASVQPAFITSDVDWLERRLGTRVASTYAFGELSRAGVKMVGGSDCPVEAPNPWPGMAAAVSGGLDPATAFGLFAGELRAGAPADLIVADRDPLTTLDLASTRVLAVYRHGTRVDLEAALPFT